jgi:sugar (pentulose or hexulose) kinase
MTNRYLMGIDSGTSVTKVVVFDTEGNELGGSQAPITTVAPRPGWVEEEPGAAWEALKKAIRRSLEEAGIPARDVSAIGCTAHMGGAWLLDERGRELRNGIVWTDGRAGPILAEWRRTGVAEKAFELSGNALLTGFTLVLVRWLAENEGDTLAQARHVLVPKDWIRFKLTGEVATDETDLSWMPGDPFGRAYSEELFELLGIGEHRRLFPDPKPSDSLAGELLPGVAGELGLAPGTPVAVGMGDALAGHYALGAIYEGQAGTILGTALINGLTTSRPVLEPTGIGFQLCTVGGKWVRMVNNTGGGNVNLTWFLNTLCESQKREAEERGVSVFELLEAEAEGVTVGSNGVVFHPYANPAGVVAPFYNLDAAANFFGIRIHNTHADMLRAVYEGVAMAARDCFSAVPVPLETLRLTGGGARSALWCQIFADCLGVPCEITRGEETTAKGAAMLAGVAAGIFSDYRDAVERTVRVGRVHRPNPARRADYEELHGLYREIREGLDDAWSLRDDVYSKLGQSLP